MRLGPVIAAQEHWAADGEVLIPVLVRAKGVDFCRRYAAVPHPVRESEDRGVKDGSQCWFDGSEARVVAVNLIARLVAASMQRRGFSSQQPGLVCSLADSSAELSIRGARKSFLPRRRDPSVLVLQLTISPERAAGQ